MSADTVTSHRFVLDWWAGEPPDDGRRHVVYRGALSGYPDLRLRFGFDGWGGPAREAAFEIVEPGVAVAVVEGVDDEHLTLDAVVTAGEQWDNNGGADYRLWLDLEPVDAHVHASHDGGDRFGAAALHAGLASAGIRTAVLSWRDNHFVDELARVTPGFHPLVWVTPGHPTVATVRDRLANGHVGLKLHPSDGGFPADDQGLNPYLEVAREAGRPVAVHSAPGPSDPDLIRRLAERFPDVDFILYHTYMGLPEGRRRAIAHAQELDNLWLETSWCSSRFAVRAVDEVGPEKVVFGSDGGVDGWHHYGQDPPNIELRETYKDAMLEMARHLEPASARLVLAENARRLFRLAASPRTARDEGVTTRAPSAPDPPGAASA